MNSKVLWIKSLLGNLSTPGTVHLCESVVLGLIVVNGENANLIPQKGAIETRLGRGGALRAIKRILKSGTPARLVSISFFLARAIDLFVGAILYNNN